jgi:hypothetical protein
MNDIDKMDIRIYSVAVKDDNYILKNITEIYKSFKRIVGYSFIQVREFVSMDKIPELFIYDRESTLQIMKDLSLENWVKAFSAEGKIHLLSGFFKSRRQLDILNHEMFHCGVYQCTKNEPLIPKWFNEAIAYYISNNSRIDKMLSKEIIAIPFDKLKLWVKKDLLIEKCSLAYEIIKSIGNHFCNIYQAATVKDIVYDTWIKKDFDRAFIKHTSFTIDDFLEKWLNKLILS